MDKQDDTDGAALSPAAASAVHYRSVIRDNGTLSAADSDKYRASVRTLRRKEGRERTWIAELLGISPGAVNRLLRAKPSAHRSCPEGAAA